MKESRFINESITFSYQVAEGVVVLTNQINIVN